MEEPEAEAQSLQQKAEKLSYLTTGPLSISISNLSGPSRFIPTAKDFHFYNNFDEFKNPVSEIVRKSQSLLQTIGSSSQIWGKTIQFPQDFDEDAQDWLVSVNDEVFERFDSSIDEFQSEKRTKKDVGNGFVKDSDDGFELVIGKRKKRGSLILGGGDRSRLLTAATMAERDPRTGGMKLRVPFHLPHLPRPQDTYTIYVNNTNVPFEHVWLERSEDGSRLIHPLEKESVLAFVDKDKDTGDQKPVKPLSLEDTPFKLVEEVKDLKELAAKLRGVDEFAVDLEHNQYRSFQGLTCLMQISTRTEDYVVDTLKLRVYIGPYLREVFRDPTKRKVMHGADRDILWLQRDFSIYICNMFDTGQASRVLKLERNSLEHLLKHYCGVSADKEYQNGDWRIRPLPDTMLKYAREDTHYLLYIYDLMRIRLSSMRMEPGMTYPPLVEVYKRSYDICMQLYEKDIFTENSYLNTYGLQDTLLNAQQLAVLAGLFEWRDGVAREEDESTGYILPNKSLIELATKMPVTVSKLRSLIKHSHIERHFGSIAAIIMISMQHAAKFEAVAQHLREMWMEAKAAKNIEAPEETTSPSGGSEALLSPKASPTTIKITAPAATVSDVASVVVKEEPSEPQNDTDKQVNVGVDTSVAISGQIGEANADLGVSHSAEVTGATVEVLKKPSRAFGAMFGNSGAKRKLDTDKKDKVEQIKSSVNLRFQPFSGTDEKVQPVEQEHTSASEVPQIAKEPVPLQVTNNNPQDIIMLEEGSLNVEQEEESTKESKNEVASEHQQQQKHEEEGVSEGSDSERENVNGSSSLLDLSSSFQKLSSPSKPKQVEKSPKAGAVSELKPFDYGSAREKLRFEDDPEEGEGTASMGERMKKKPGGGEEGSSELRPGRRSQAFPMSGNRSATYK